jgi:hypothetical protein
MLFLLTGCHGHTLPTQADVQAKADATAIINSQRDQISQIPPPSKTRYMAVHTFESWENPYLTVQSGMLELHVTVADANESSFGAGGMLRPVGARRQVLNIAPEKLGDAITAIPQTAWPYGRVVAIEEAHKTPASAEPAVRRTMEVAIRDLNDLGIVVYDMSEGKLQ